jgi:hypothetical protein
MSQGFHRCIAVLNPNGDTLRHVPSALARSMVEGRIAEVRETRGRIREIVLSQPASSHALRTGSPSAFGFGIRFYRWERLDGCAGRIFQHHPRCLYGQDL